MKRYTARLEGISNLSTSSGESIVIPDQFYTLTGKIVSKVNFCQNLIQKTVYNAYGAEFNRAGHSLKEATSPKKRLDFLNSYNSISDDEVTAEVFLQAKSIFLDAYEFRCELTHDRWASSEQIPDTLLLSSLDEEARLEFASGKLKHDAKTTAIETHTAIMRYIQSLKAVQLPHLQEALSDLNHCSWCLMQIGFVVAENDEDAKIKLRSALLTFKRTSSLFPKDQRKIDPISISRRQHHEITK